MPFSTSSFLSERDRERVEGLQLALPWALGADSPVWTRGDDVTTDLAKQYVSMQDEADLRLFSSIDALIRTMAGFTPTGSQPPPQVIGRIEQPDGSPAVRVQVGLAAALDTTSDARLGSTVTGQDGDFVLPVPRSARSAAGLAGLRIVAGNGVQTLPDALRELQPTGALPPVRLSQPASPLPIGLLEQLRPIVDEAGTGSLAVPVSTPSLAIGEDECEIVFRKDQSADRFPFGVLFRLTDPALSQLSLQYVLDDEQKPHSYYGPFSPAAVLAEGAERLRFRLAARVPIDRPISVDAFRDGIAAEAPAGVPLAGSLAIGYVVRLAQRWTPLGLALGDLVYSLPLAPGEQQRIAVMERTSSTSVIESERLESAEQMSFAEADDTSSTATFASAFTEVASGGSHYDTEASSFSTAAAAGGGGVFPFGCAAGGVSTSFGTSSTAGNTATWMSGARNSTSDVAQRTHSSVQRQAAARRSASRTAMRLATASETDRIVTKVITNHNKTRALTMQYWEVQRLFDVTSVTEGVDLVCMVPLDVIRFLRPGQPVRLIAAPTSREQVLTRYGQLLKHADVLRRVVPIRERRGLALIADFAADPTSSVGSAADPAEDVLSVKITASVLPFEDVFLTVVGKRGQRVGPVRVANTSAVPLPEGKAAYANEETLFGKLRSARAADAGSQAVLTAAIALPASFARQDVVGFEVSRRFRRLDYAFPPPLAADLGFASSILGTLSPSSESLVGAIGRAPSVTRSYGPDRLERELGGPRSTGVSVTLPGVAELVATPASDAELPTGPYPFAARTIPPQLSYASVLEVEKTLQWAMRNTMTCSIAVFASITPEERVVLLERYQITLPPAEEGTPREAVPLLSCVTNSVLGYYGNSMVLPFQIPAEMTTALAHRGEPPLTTAAIQDALTRFHTDGFDGPRATIALPTRGVLGEAVLGHCPSAEKIDLTRFWNWQDSPGDEATAINPVELPTTPLSAGLTGPDSLKGLTPQIQNFSMAPVAADTALAAALLTNAGQQKDFDAAALTNAANLGTLTGKTLDTAEAARKDALASATQLAVKAMETSASIYEGAAKDKEKKDGKKAEDTPKPEPDDPPPAPPKPTTASIHFALDSTSLTVPPASTELPALTAAATAAKAAHATGATIRGFASPEGPAAHNVDLARNRAAAVVAHLGTVGVTATAAEGGVLPGASGDYPALRRADVQFTY